MRSTSASHRPGLTATLLIAAGIVTAALAAVTAAATSAQASEPSFADVAGTGYEDAVDALLDAEVFRGCGEDAFCPDAPLTRAQAASVLVNALDLPLTEFRHFGDIDGNVHAAAIDALGAARISNGCGDGDYCPDDVLTRAEAASLLARAFDVPDVGERFFGDTAGVHANAIDRLAAVGIAAGCGDPLTAFCPDEPVLRWHAALFVGRALQLVDRVEVTTLEQRQQVQAEMEAEAQRQLEEAQRQAEEAQRQAEQEAARERELAERRAIWYRLAECEANGNWRAVSANGLYYGGLQFHLQTWRAYKPASYPSNPVNATPDQQIFVAERVLVGQGWGAWPHCSRVIGMR